MIKILSMSVIAAFAITSIAVSTPAHAGLLDKILGKEEAPQTPPPEVTLQAPFATKPDAKDSKNKLMDIYGSNEPSAETSTDLSKPHRNEKQIIDWTTEIVTQAMSINPATYTEDFKKVSPYFTPYALQEYNAYLGKANMMNILHSNSMRLQSVSDEEGTVIKDASISGTYHWLVQIPIMATYYNVDIQSVDKSTTSQNQNLIVQVQVGRVAPKVSGDIGMVIERWSVSSNAKR